MTALSPSFKDSPLLKSPREIDLMDRANHYVHRLLDKLTSVIKPGISTMDLESIAEDYCSEHHLEPSFKGYHDYPACLCVSINDEIVHGIPSASKLLRDGDIVSIDFGIKHEGYHGDAARTYPVGHVSSSAKKLMTATLKSLKAAVDAARPGNTLGDVGFAVQNTVEPLGYGVVRDFVGHGIGMDMHEPPQVPNFGRRGHGQLIRSGLVIAIEPMVCEGTWKIKVDSDGWTARTNDGKLSAHFEYSVAVEDEGPRILGDPGF